MDTATNRKQGVLFGGAVGDSLGTSLEFSATKGDFPRLHSGPHKGITGGGPFSVAKGQITDDTMMAVALYSSLKARARLDSRDVARRYSDWRIHTFDIGGQTSGAIHAFNASGKATTAGLVSWARGGRHAAGNGSLMRTWAIPAYDPRTNVVERSIADSLITHADPLCLLACASYNAAIAHALNAPAPTPHGMWKAARAGLLKAYKLLPSDFTAAEKATAYTAISDDLRAAQDSNPGFGGKGPSLSGGFVRTAFRLAFWTLLHAPDYRSAVVHVANCGGDADTNTAIAGALFGALVGRSGIPAGWVDTVINCKTRHGGKLDTVYHPRIFAD